MPLACHDNSQPELQRDIRSRDPSLAFATTEISRDGKPDIHQKGPSLAKTRGDLFRDGRIESRLCLDGFRSETPVWGTDGIKTGSNR